MAPAARRALLPFALHALARESDRALGVVLHTSLAVPSLGLEALRLVDLRRAALALVAWTLGGALLWIAMSLLRCRGQRRHLPAALALEADAFRPLYLRPALTLLALASVTLHGAYPYAFTLPVALTQDWGAAQDGFALAALAAGLRLPAPLRVPRPNAAFVFALALAGIVALTPSAARTWRAHTGNEPKYLRQAEALATAGTLDVSGIDAPLEQLPAAPIGTLLGRGLRAACLGASATATALVRGEGFAPPAIAPDSQLTVRGREGGAFHVLAPGPGFLLAPLLRADRALNLARETPQRLDVSVAIWNLLSAALVAAVFVLARDASGRPFVAAILALAAAFTPPLLFYANQFYPEVPAALLLALALRRLIFAPRDGRRGAISLGLVLAPLPWLHQKYLPVAVVLLAWSILSWRRERGTKAALAALVVPLGVSLWLFLAHNFVVTGSARPDALFRALGREGVSTATLGQGALGLLFDASYGLLPCVPLALLALAGLAGAARVGRAWPVAAAYFLTVASADNWTGSISNLGRFLLPLVPLGVAAAATLWSREVRRDRLALVLMLGAWTALVTLALWRDPFARNDSAVLLGKSVFADGLGYIPALWRSHWSDAGLVARCGAWLLATAGAAFWLRRIPTSRPEVTPARVLAGTAAALLLLAFVLERWPSPRNAPRFPNTVTLRRGGDVFVSGDVERDGDGFRIGRGGAELLVRSQAPRPTLRVSAAGEGVLRVAALAPFPLSASGALVDVPLEEVRTFHGEHGLQETLYRQHLGVDREGVVLSIPDLRRARRKR